MFDFKINAPGIYSKKYGILIYTLNISNRKARKDTLVYSGKFVRWLQEESGLGNEIKKSVMLTSPV